MAKARPPIDRFLEMVEWSDEWYEGTRCLRWTASLTWGGYGRIQVDGVKRVAHRWIYERWFGPVPDVLVMDHLCRNRWCMNPVHLEPVTNAENIRRGSGPGMARARNFAKTHCAHGHEFSEENTYQEPSTGHRICRECRRQKERGRYGRRRDKARALRETSQSPACSPSAIVRGPGT